MKKILLITITAIMLSVSLPARAEIKLITPLPGQSGATQSVSGLADYLVKIYNLGLIVAGVLALAGLVFGGFLYMTSSYSGNVVKTAGGLDIVKSSLLGLAIALLSYLLMYTLDPNLTRPKDAFFSIPEGTCSGGIPNVEDQSICDSYCYAYVDGAKAAEEDQIYTASYDSGTKCCRCVEKITPCEGPYAHGGIASNSQCAQICASPVNCPAGKICGKVDYSPESQCCTCSVLDSTELAVTCEHGSKLNSDAVYQDCANYCCPDLGESGCGVANYYADTKCCSCLPGFPSKNNP